MGLKLLKNTLLAFIIIFVSCQGEKEKSNDSKNTTVTKKNEIVKTTVIEDSKLLYNLDEDVTYKDVLNLKEYSKLTKDKNYKKYIKKYWNTNIKNKKGMFLAFIELGADMQILGSKIEKKTKKDDPLEDGEKLLGLGKLVSKSLWSMTKGIKSTYGLIELEKKQKKLYSSFSSNKKKIATKFEKKLNEIINYSCDFPKNPNVKENDTYQNYKSLNESLKEDEDVVDFLEPITEKLDNFFINNVELKSKLSINKALGVKRNNKELSDYGEKILKSNGNYNVNVKSDMLEDFYSELNDILKYLNNQNFETPVEDWSEEKSNNFKFIIKDIKIRLLAEVQSLNI